MKNVTGILIKVLDVVALVRSNPSLFDFSRLEINDKINLLNNDLKFFRDKIDVAGLDPNDKARVIMGAQNKKVAQLVELTEDEISRISNSLYFELVKADVRKYIRKEKFAKMAKYEQQEIFLLDPEWVIKNFGAAPKLTSERLQTLARTHPKFIDQYIHDFSLLTTTNTFWILMIQHDKKYKEIFVKNTNSLISKSQVRDVIWKYPDIIKLIGTDTLVDSKLTVKEWILLISSAMSSKESVFENWQFADDVAEMMKLDVMSEVLNGKSKISTRFQSAMKSVFGKEEKNED